MKILITGGCGFIGSQAVRQFSKNHDVVVFDKLTYSGFSEHIYGLKNVVLIRGDLAKKTNIRDCFKKFDGFDSVIHIAAESSVDKSIRGYKDFVNSNILGSANLFDLCLKYKVKKVINFGCYDTETLIWTPDGLKSYLEVKSGDEILSITSEGVVENDTIESVHEYDYDSEKDGDLVHFSTSTVDCAVTPNHRVYFYRKDADSSLEVLRADEVSEITNVYLPRGRHIGENNEQVEVKGLGVMNAEALFYVSGFFVADGFLAYQERQVENKSGLNKEELMVKGRDPKTGRFFSTGKIGNRETTALKCHRIFFDVPENDKGRKRLEQSLTKLGISWSAHKGKAGEHLYFSSREWSEYFKQFGKYAKNKTIPRWMLQYSHVLLKSLLDGIIDGDGHYTDFSCFCLSTVSKKLVTASIELGTRLGWHVRFTNLGIQTSTYQGRTITGTTDAYAVWFKKEKLGIGKGRNVREAYRGKVWCLTIKNNKNFLSSRNGITVFSGNTDEIYGHLTKEGESFTELTPIQPRNIYSASKASQVLMGQAFHLTHGLPIVTVCPSNCYGPRQMPDKLLPRMIYLLNKDKALPVYGTGANVREWLFVEDLAEALVLLNNLGVPGETYNAGSSNEMANLDILKLLSAKMEKELNIEFIVDRKGHDFRYSVNFDKLQALGWKPKTSLEDGLGKTIKWYLSNLSWLEMNYKKMWKK